MRVAQHFSAGKLPSDKLSVRVSGQLKSWESNILQSSGSRTRFLAIPGSSTEVLGYFRIARYADGREDLFV